MNKFLKFHCITISILFSTLAIAQNPTISIQSTLKNISGDAVPDGNQSITFNLYAALEGDTSVWTETASVEVVSGIYSHELGSVTALNPNNFGQQLYLGVTINNKELSPRTKMGYAPYALAVTALAGSGESASFDGNGKFVVSKDMSVATNMTVGGTISSSSNISNTGTIISSGLIQSTGAGIFGTEIRSTGNMACGGASVGGALDLAIGHHETGMKGDNSSLNFHCAFTNPKMTILANGRVGIGTANPVTTLHVKENGLGSANSGTTSFFTNHLWGNSNLVNTPNNVTIGFAAYIEGRLLADYIATGYNYTWSDNRIKTILQKSNSKSDLDLLNQIEITEYEHIDKLKGDNRTQKKVIAQQVQQVLPNAISMSSKVIPNVYEIAKNFEYKSGVLRVQTDKAHGFVIGDKIDLKTPKKDMDRIEVIAVIDTHTFEVKADEKPENVFVYGKYVDDFLSVDYDAIAMLNVSASQEMYRMIMDLQQANNNLIKENNALKSSSASIEDRLARLEAMMVRSESTSTNNTSSAGE